MMTVVLTDFQMIKPARCTWQWWIPD